MSKGETVWQKNKKNKNRPKAGEIGFKSSIQHNYNKKKVIINEKQGSLL